MRICRYARQVPLPLIYRGNRLDCGYRLDVVIQNELVLEVKAVERLLPIHDAQILSYLRLGGYKTGLLLNFHTVVLKDGIRSFVL
jgi:GxxExxY protein